MVTRVLLALAVLAIAFLTSGSGSPPAAFQSSGLRELSRSQLCEAHHQLQDEFRSNTRRRGQVSADVDEKELQNIIEKKAG